MKNKKLLLIAMLTLSWATLPFLGKDALKKYLPAGIFICVFTKILDEYGERKRWWKFYKGIPPFDSMNFLNFGPYFATSLWVLKKHYGNFGKFLMINTLIHFVFIFILLKFIKKLKILSLVRLTKLQYLIIDFIRACLLYSFQWLMEKGKAFFGTEKQLEK